MEKDTGRVLFNSDNSTRFFMRHIKLLAILITLFTYYGSAQRVSEAYLTGSWKSMDSSTGIKSTVRFERNGTMTFRGEEKTIWKYIAQINDSIIFLTYNIESKSATLHNEGVLVIQNNNCLWWFNPNDYEKYTKTLQNEYNITCKGKFETWLKTIRDVYYRIEAKKKS